MIKNRVGDLYVGVSNNPKERLTDHNSKRGATFTKHSSDYRVCFLEEHALFSDARKREVQIKKWRREKKEMLIQRYQNGLPTKFDE
jgi:putative endonuclease